MTLSRQNFDDLSERDLLAQIDAGVPEGILVDYKRDMYGRSDGDAREFLKDISSFANTAGGHLIIGMAEAAGIPTALAPLAGDSDDDLQRLENLARDGLEPRVVGLRMKKVPLAVGGYALVLRIPRSWNPPHRVAARNTNRIYGRNSAGAYEYSVEELRVVFTSAASALDRARAFRAERLARIDAGEAIVPLVIDRGRLVLHLVPLSAFGLGHQVDVERAHSAQQLMRPMQSSGYSPSINFDGFANVFHHGSDGLCWSYTHIFRNGALEAVKARTVSDLYDGALWIPAQSVGEWIFEVLPSYFDVLRKLDIAPPIVVMVTLQGVRGARLGISQRQSILDPPPIIDRSVLELPEILVEQYGTELDYHNAVRPAFDALWNAGGYARSDYFDEMGRWNPNWRQRRG